MYPSSQGQISNQTNSPNNVLLLPSNTSKMSFIIPNTNTNTNPSQQPIVSSTNILSSNTGMTNPSINLNGTTSISSGQTPQQRLSIPQRSTISRNISKRISIIIE
jgi:hypothetical protein